MALGDGRTAVEIAAGFAFACARLDDGTVKCWGDNASGQVGVGDSEGRAQPDESRGPRYRTQGRRDRRRADSCVAARLDSGIVKLLAATTRIGRQLGDRPIL